MNFAKKKIGIIGGAGPAASCKLYQLMVNECQQNYGCVADANFPEIIIISYPFAHMVSWREAEKNHVLLVKQLQACVDRLVQQGAQVIAIACNTLHTFLDAVSIPDTCELVHIGHATRARVQKHKRARVLLLATSTTAASQIYPDFLVPSRKDQECIDGIITTIMGGNLCIADAQMLGVMVHTYQADGVILGCTELPLLYAQYQDVIASSCAVFDTLAVLAQEVVQRSYLAGER